MKKFHDIWVFFFMISAFILVLLGISCKILPLQDPFQTDMTKSLQYPSINNLFGTDILGRDIFSRVLYGIQVSVVLSMITTILSVCVGLLIGLTAGYFGGIPDTIITIFTSIFQGLPATIIMITVAAMMGGGYYALLFSMVMTSWTGFSRMVRGEVLKLKTADYIIVGKSMGASNIRIIFYYIFPAVCHNLIIVFAQRIAAFILSIAGLSYLGLGIHPPTPDLGGMINEARNYYRSQPMTIIAPGAVLLMISLGINYFAEWLRENFFFKQSIKKGES
jgi:dipeptide/oligopeptide/nickel ABC transporter, permease protein